MEERRRRGGDAVVVLLLSALLVVVVVVVVEVVGVAVVLVVVRPSCDIALVENYIIPLIVIIFHNAVVGMAININIDWRLSCCL